MGKSTSFILILLHFYILSFAQLQDSIFKKYPFLGAKHNQIQNSQYLKNTILALQKLQSNKDTVINIIHIGDSHIQADYLSNTIRNQLQLNFGNAGRGLIFPAKILKTNESYCYKTSYTGNWQGKKILKQNDSLQAGLMGFVVKTFDNKSSFKIYWNDVDSIHNKFDRVEVLYENNVNNFPLQISNKDFLKVSNLQVCNDKYLIEDFKSDKSCCSIGFSFDTSGTLNGNFKLFALNLKYGNKGVIYHSIGVNGAEYKHYNRSDVFMEQLSIIKPQLIVVSLGTNDAYDANFSKEEFILKVDSFFNKIKSVHPNAEYIVIGPGDANKKVTKRNLRNVAASNALEIYCNENKIAFYNLLKVMGGYGSINKWFSKGLTAKDRLHLNKKGYELQGLLFSLAFKQIFDSNLQFGQ